MLSGPACAFASRMACRREPGPMLLIEVTSKSVGTRRFSSSSTPSKPRGLTRFGCEAAFLACDHRIHWVWQFRKNERIETPLPWSSNGLLPVDWSFPDGRDLGYRLRPQWQYYPSEERWQR